jgi:uncharacterized integral membrane protein
LTGDLVNQEILASIRAYGAQTTFKEESLRRINHYTRAARTFYNLNRWICVRIDTISGMFAASLAAYLVYFQGHSAASIGFSLNMAGLCGHEFRCSSELICLRQLGSVPTSYGGSEF